MGTVISNICIREFQIVEIHVLGLLEEGTRMPCGLMQLDENPWRYPAELSLFKASVRMGQWCQDPLLSSAQ